MPIQNTPGHKTGPLPQKQPALTVEAARKKVEADRVTLKGDESNVTAAAAHLKHDHDQLLDDEKLAKMLEQIGGQLPDDAAALRELVAHDRAAVRGDLQAVAQGRTAVQADHKTLTADRATLAKVQAAAGQAMPDPGQGVLDDAQRQIAAAQAKGPLQPGVAEGVMGLARQKANLFDAIVANKQTLATLDPKKDGGRIAQLTAQIDSLRGQAGQIHPAEVLAIKDPVLQKQIAANDATMATLDPVKDLAQLENLDAQNHLLASQDRTGHPASQNGTDAVMASVAQRTNILNTIAANTATLGTLDPQRDQAQIAKIAQQNKSMQAQIARIDPFAVLQIKDPQRQDQVAANIVTMGDLDLAKDGAQFDHLEAQNRLLAYEDRIGLPAGTDRTVAEEAVYTAVAQRTNYKNAIAAKTATRDTLDPRRDQAQISQLNAEIKSLNAQFARIDPFAVLQIKDPQRQAQVAANIETMGNLDLAKDGAQFDHLEAQNRLLAYEDRIGLPAGTDRTVAEEAVYAVVAQRTNYKDAIAAMTATLGTLDPQRDQAKISQLNREIKSLNSQLARIDPFAVLQIKDPQRQAQVAANIETMGTLDPQRDWAQFDQLEAQNHLLAYEDRTGQPPSAEVQGAVNSLVSVRTNAENTLVANTRLLGALDPQRDREQIAKLRQADVALRGFIGGLDPYAVLAPKDPAVQQAIAADMTKLGTLDPQKDAAQIRALEARIQQLAHPQQIP